MKKYLTFGLVLILLAITAVPAFAAATSPDDGGIRLGGNSPFALAGKISALDPAARTVTVSVITGNKWVKPFIGKTLTLQTADTTRFLLRNPAGTATLITYNDLVAGQSVSVSGVVSANVWTAQRITVGAALVHQP